MIQGFDRITIAVPDLAVAMANYQTLLGAKFWMAPGTNGMKTAWLGLANTVIELEERAIEAAELVAMVFVASEAEPAQRAIANTLNIGVSVCDGAATASFRRQQPDAQNPALKVDHLVLRTGNADACIELFGVGLGIRLALDKSAPQWGGRMLFFRVGKLTLEVIEPSENKCGHDRLWGLAFQCQDVSSTTAQLDEVGVKLSPLRAGRKPGTTVATVKSHNLGIPTLLIEPAPAL